MTAGSAIKYAVVNEWNRREDSILRRFVMPLVTTAAGADTTHLACSSLARGAPSGSDFDRRELEIMELVAGGPAVGEISAVTAYAAGVLTLDPALSVLPKSGTDFILYESDLSPEVLTHEINGVLQDTEAPHLWFPSLVADSELDAAALANWTDIGTPSTPVAYNATAANMLFGTQALHVVCDAAGEGFASDSFNVTEGESLIIAVYVKCAVSDCRVQLYNVTTGEEIRGVTVDEQAWTKILFRESVPDNCEQASIRFLAVAANSEFYVSAPVIVQSQSGRPYVAPSWFTSPEKYVEAWQFPAGLPSEAADSYVALSEGAVEASDPELLYRPRGLNPMIVQFASCGDPLALGVVRPFAALSNVNTGTTPCDLAYATWQVLANLFEQQGVEGARVARARARRRAQAMHYGDRSIEIRSPGKVGLRYGW